jgi:4-diphosphocytidyl-2-C-methyl-D-erythritol kinase
LNLFLEVVGRREDGYHEIESLMVTVDLYDTLCFKEEPSGEVTLQCDDVSGVGSPRQARPQSLPEGPDNLVVQMADRLRTETGTKAGVRIRLTKRIPLAAGLAGGSSDAAATLAALNRLWNLGLSPDELCRLAAMVGSDVAFFLHAPAAVCRGRGEQVEPLTLPYPLHFVIACPNEGLSTATVYRHCRPPAVRQLVQPFVDRMVQGHLGANSGRSFLNRLQPAAQELSPAVERLSRLFDRLPWVGHQMSGSGSAYFGLCRSHRQARRLGDWLRQQQIGRVYVVRSSP